MSETTMGDLAEALFTRPDWWAKAACTGIETDRFYPRRGEPVNNLKRLCFFCEVKQECLDDALSRFDKNGMFGGRSERERRRMRRLRRAAAASGETYLPLAIDYLPPADPWPRPKRRPAPRFDGQQLVHVRRSKKAPTTTKPRRRPGARFDGKQLVRAA